MTLTIGNKCELLRPMACRDVLRLAWLHADMYPEGADGPRVRTRRWCDAGFPESPDPARLYIDGPEPAIRRAIIDAVARITVPPVRQHIATHLLFVGIGRQTRGWQSLWRAFDHPVDEAPQVIVIAGAETDPEELASVIAHEVAHAWLADVVRTSPPVADLADDDPGLMARLMREWSMPDETVKPILDRRRRQERRAGALARSWGFTGTAADPDSCARRYRLASDD